MIIAAHTTALVLLADGSGGESKKAGPIGLVVILLLCFACYFLFRSMSRHLKRVREQFPSDEQPRSAEHPHPSSSGNGAGRMPAPQVRRTDAPGAPPPESRS